MFEPLATDADLLGAAREHRTIADQAEAKILQLACDWADAHPPRDIEEIGTYRIAGGESPFTIAGEGCPLVAEFAVTEFAAALGLGTESGKHLIGQALELKHRLPRMWARVQSGQVQVWRARRIAEQTIPLSPDAAAHVDRHLAPVAHSARPWQIDRLVADAIARFMPATAEATRQAALDRRHVTLETSQVSFEGTCWMTGELDLADAQDLDTALATGAEALKAGGSTESLDVRRSLALGDLARGQAALDLTQPAPQPQRAKRQALLHLHLSDAALTDRSVTGTVEETRMPVTADTIRHWLGHPDTQVILKPVIDLNSHQQTDAYEVPDRIREQITLRDQTCVFPYCTRPARRLDCDHIKPYDPDAPPGQTCTCNLAPLCRHHHRVKTHDHRGSADHGGWTYIQLEPGVFLWRSPTGLTFLRDPTAPATSPPPTGRPTRPPGTGEIDPAPHPAHQRGHRHAFRPATLPPCVSSASSCSAASSWRRWS